MSRVVAPACTKLNRTPRTPSLCNRWSSSSLTDVSTTATPRAFEPIAAMPSSVTWLFVPYADGVTTTHRGVPIRSWILR